MNEPLAPLTLDRFLAASRLGHLRLSPDGKRLIVAISKPDPEGKEMRTTIWQVDPEGKRAPRRLTRSTEGESSACFASDGSLLFTSSRPDPDKKADPEHKISALWSLPPEGGEARLLIAPDGGVTDVVAARHSDAIAFGALLHPLAADMAQDEAKAKARKDAGVGALLFDSRPIRWWDHWLAPRRQRLFAAPLPEDPEGALQAADLTGDPGPVFMEVEFDLSPDGKTVAVTWQDWSKTAASPLVLIDVASKKRRTITELDGDYDSPRFSPDGRFVACFRTTTGSPDEAAVRTLWLIELSTGQGRPLAAHLEQWAESLVWSDDSKTIFYTAPRQGHEAAYRLDVATGQVSCLVAEGSVTDLCPSPDGKTVYALMSDVSEPARIVRFAAAGENQTPTQLARAPQSGVAGRGRVERLEATASDGEKIGSWLVIPPPDVARKGPAPVVVFAHGGPIGTWSGWHWRWNPHLIAEAGYAVLMPDPAISIGYGQRMIQRGWGKWGQAPYTDIIAALDAALARPDLDAKRTALMGGSFGGYMANWVAGQTDRFKAIVTHASLWDLRPFHGTTDDGPRWEYEMGDPYADPDRYDRQSPATFIAEMARNQTPLLVIHGERDFRVPISEALRLWTDMGRFGVPGRFLYFPDENHWILRPPNSRLWYQTVTAFLDENVLGKDWVRPDLL